MNLQQAPLVDAAGTPHRRVAPGEPVRIVCLVPSVTELLCDLGLADRIVGRTGFCIHPATAVAAIAKVGGTKDVNEGKIARLAPTHLVVNIDENEKPTVERLARFVPNVIVTHPLGPEDNPPLFRLLGGIFGVEEAAERLCARFGQAMAPLRDRPPAALSALYCIWRDPWMCAGKDTYIANMLALAGLRAWYPDGGARYPVFEWTPETVAGVDLVLLSTEPYRFTEAHATELEARLGKPVRLVDGEMLSWYGSRSIAGLSYLQLLRNNLL